MLRRELSFLCTFWDLSFVTFCGYYGRLAFHTDNSTEDL